MKIIDILNFNKELLNKIYTSGIQAGDYRYVELYNEFQTMKMQGEKITYAVAVLSEKYGVSERKVYDLVKRFDGDCNSFAAA